jgi:hypothetical protein
VSDHDHAPERRDGRDGPDEAVGARMGEELRTARAEVFRAYLRARDKARALDDEDDGDAPDRDRRFERRRAS